MGWLRKARPTVPSCETTEKVTKTIEKWSADKALGHRQTKKLIKEYTPKFTEGLLNKGMRTMRLIVGLLT